MIRANILRRIRPQKISSRLKSDKPDEHSPEEGIKTFSDDRVSSHLKANPDEVLSADKFLDELDKPMKASDLEKRGADEIYEKFMEMKDYDGDGRLQRNTYARLQAFGLQAGSIAPHIIMDENHADFLIIGGGLAGNVLANRIYNACQSVGITMSGRYFEEQFSTRPDLEPPKIVILEKDPDGVVERSHLKPGISRVQWTNENNIGMAKASMRFLRELEVELAVLGEQPPEINFTPQGTLLLGTKADQAHMLESYYTQEKCETECRLYRGKALKRMFPWLNTDDIDMASYSLEEEGFFDTRELLEAFKRNNISKGIKYVKGELSTFNPIHCDEDFDRKDRTVSSIGNNKFAKSYATMTTPQGKVPINYRVNECHVKVDDFPIDVPISFFRAFLCTGSSTADVLEKSGLVFDEDPEMTSMQRSLIPIQKRIRNNFLLFCPDLPVLDMPILVDPDGIVLKREDFDGHYVVMYHPRNDENPEIKVGDPDVDWQLWHEVVKPKLIHRVPAFENHEVKAAWCNTVDVNTFDHNPIVGAHPYWRSISLFCGFGGHGLAQMIGAADFFAMKEYNPFYDQQSFKNDWRYKTAKFDVQAYNPMRLLLRYPLREQYTWS